MARIPLLSEDDPDLPPEVRAYLDGITRTRGSVINIYRAMANHPTSARAFTNLAGTVYRGATTLAPRHAYLTATTVNSCYY